jgi:hypothetical protein
MENARTNAIGQRRFGCNTMECSHPHRLDRTAAALVRALADTCCIDVTLSTAQSELKGGICSMQLFYASALLHLKLGLLSTVRQSVSRMRDIRDRREHVEQAHRGPLPDQHSAGSRRSH